MAKNFGGHLPSSTASGSANATKAVSLTGNQKLDGILTEVAWGGKSIDYSFPTTKSVYGYTQETDLPQGFFKTTLGQQNAARFALDADSGVNAAASAGFSVEGFTNLGVKYDATPDNDQIRVANTTASWLATAEVADFPGNYTTKETQDNGDVWFGTGYRGTIYDYAKPVMGNYAWHSHLHEIGHALGLKHGNEDSLAGPLPSNVDSIEFSVMTYRGYIGDDANGYEYENWDAPQTYMMLDIAALQHMYGADFTTNSGSTVYTWTPGNGNTLVNGVAAITPGGNRIFATVWDGGGTDTYDLSAYKTSLKIDLNAGGYSTFAAGQLADLGGGPNGGYARGNIFNALQYNGDARSLIENAIGGSGNDTILGNQVKNILTGNGGKDTLNGAVGNDVLVGGAGSDVLIGGRGSDGFVFKAVSDSPAGASCDVLKAGGGAAAFDLPGGGSGDRIDLSAIDANSGLAGNQAFVFGGTGVGHLSCVNVGNVTEILGNTGGSSAAEFQLNIEDGASVLSGAYQGVDFIL